MTTGGQKISAKLGALGMLLLLAFSAFAPMAGGLLLKHHRAQRQIALRRGRTDLAPIRIVLAEQALGNAYFPEKNELELEGLRYDVVSYKKEGNCFIFNAIPDIKETHIRAVTFRSILYPAGPAIQKAGFEALNYLYYSEVLPSFLTFECFTPAVFHAPKALKLAGFDWLFSPPPDWDQVL